MKSETANRKVPRRWGDGASQCVANGCGMTLRNAGKCNRSGRDWDCICSGPFEDAESYLVVSSL
jgi:hypothetical protein